MLIFFLFGKTGIMAVLFDALPFCTTNDKNAIEQKKLLSKQTRKKWSLWQNLHVWQWNDKNVLACSFCVCMYLSEWLVPFYCRKYSWILMILIVEHIFTNLFISFARRLSRRTFLFVWLEFCQNVHTTSLTFWKISFTYWTYHFLFARFEIPFCVLTRHNNSFQMNEWKSPLKPFIYCLSLFPLLYCSLDWCVCLVVGSVFLHRNFQWR